MVALTKLLGLPRNPARFYLLFDTLRALRSSLCMRDHGPDLVANCAPESASLLGAQFGALLGTGLQPLKVGGELSEPELLLLFALLPVHRALVHPTALAQSVHAFLLRLLFAESSQSELPSLSAPLREALYAALSLDLATLFAAPRAEPQLLLLLDLLLSHLSKSNDQLQAEFDRIEGRVRVRSLPDLLRTWRLLDQALRLLPHSLSTPRLRWNFPSTRCLDALMPLLNAPLPEVVVGALRILTRLLPGLAPTRPLRLPGLDAPLDAMILPWLLTRLGRHGCIIPQRLEYWKRRLLRVELLREAEAEIEGAQLVEDGPQPSLVEELLALLDALVANPSWRQSVQSYLSDVITEGVVALGQFVETPVETFEVCPLIHLIARIFSLF